MSTFTPPALHGIVGYPLGHSMSPLMHNTAFRTLNLPGVYLSWPIEPGRLPAFVDAARLLNIRGCSITIPHKIDIIPLLDKTSENVREMGACNTLYRDGEKICGENTDVIGFTAPLRKRSLPPETRVLVLGAGGVSRAAIAGLPEVASPILPSPTAGKSARKPSATNSVCCALRGKSAETSPLTSSSTRHHSA